MSHDCHIRPAVTRRDVLVRAAHGFGSVALASLLPPRAGAASLANPLAAKPPHFAPKAKRAIHIFSPGGVSHIDTFDYKPELERMDGKSLTSKGTLDTFFGKPGTLLKSLYEFRQRGERGLWVSELLPHLAECADDMVFLYSMVTKSSSHTPACFQTSPTVGSRPLPHDQR